MSNLKNLSKGIAVSLASVVLLTACGGDDGESPEKVLSQFKEVAVQNETVDAMMGMNFQGSDQVDTMNMQIDADFKADYTEPLNKKVWAQLTAKADLDSTAGKTQGTLGLSLIAADSKWLFMLDDFNFNDPSMEIYQQVIENYKGTWLELSEEILTESFKVLNQEPSPEMMEKEEEIEALFVDADLFDVVKEYGTEVVNGKNTYHYEVALNETGIRAYVDGVAEITPEAVETLQEGDLDELLNATDNIDLWIGTDDYQLYKAVANFTAKNEDYPDNTFTFSLTYQANQYNQPVDVTIPEETQPFNPLELMLAVSAAGANADDGAMMEGESMQE